MNEDARIDRLENEIHGNGQVGIKDRLIRLEEVTKEFPSIKKKVDINTVLTATTLAFVLKPTAVDFLDWIFKLLHV